MYVNLLTLAPWSNFSKLLDFVELQVSLVVVTKFIDTIITILLLRLIISTEQMANA